MVVMISAFAVGVMNIFLDPLFWLLRCPVENKLQKVAETHPKRPLRSHQLTTRLRRALSEKINKKSFFSFGNWKEIFYKSEQMMTLSSRLVSWHDLIAPSLAKLESDLDFHEKFSFVNQRGVQAAIDTKGLLFATRSEKPIVDGVATENCFTIHHFMHQLKLQHSQLTGDHRKRFEESWRSDRSPCFVTPTHSPLSHCLSLSLCLVCLSVSLS
jgi:hypothetical protein